MAIERADTLADGWQLWLEWQQAVSPDNATEIQALETDRGEYLGYVRLVGRRRSQAKLSEQVTSVPAQYTKKPLLRTKESSRADNPKPSPSPNRRPARRRGATRRVARR